MITASGVRIGWADLPSAVRAGVENVLGSPVVSAISQSGGFSPGTADRVVTASGTRAFVKAVSPAQNEHSPGMHRKEIAVTRSLPPGPVPRFLGAHDDGTWVALVLEDVAGRHPVTPWREDELGQVLSTLEKIAQTTPAPTHLPDAVAGFERTFGGGSSASSSTGLLKRVCALHAVPVAEAISVLTASLGYFLDAARKPPPPGLPTVRSFQRAQADALLEWLPELADERRSAD